MGGQSEKRGSTVKLLKSTDFNSMLIRLGIIKSASQIHSQKEPKDSDGERLKYDFTF